MQIYIVYRTHTRYKTTWTLKKDNLNPPFIKIQSYLLTQVDRLWFVLNPNGKTSERNNEIIMID